MDAFSVFNSVDSAERYFKSKSNRNREFYKSNIKLSINEKMSKCLIPKSLHTSEEVASNLNVECVSNGA